MKTIKEQYIDKTPLYLQL